MKTPSRLKLAATVASVVRASTRTGGPSLPERVQSVPRLVRATLDGTYAGTTVRRLGLLAGALAYVASPIDLLPEAILPVVGAADDAVVIGWAVKAFVEETDRFAAWERGPGMHRAQTVRGEARWSDAPTAASGRGSTTPGSTTPGLPSSAWAARRSGPTANPGSADDRTGAAATRGRTGLPEGVRQAATDYVLETVRKRLER